MAKAMPLVGLDVEIVWRTQRRLHHRSRDQHRVSR